MSEAERWKTSGPEIEGVIDEVKCVSVCVCVCVCVRFRETEFGPNVLRCFFVSTAEHIVTCITVGLCLYNHWVRGQKEKCVFSFTRMYFGLQGGCFSCSTVFGLCVS